MIRRLVIGGAAALAAVVVAAPAGAAGSPPQTGVWWKAQPSDGLLPPPQSYPPGGLWVSGDPTGPESESAVRYTVAPGLLPVSLVLNVNSGTAADGDVVACVITQAWSPPAGSPGTFAELPTPSCQAGETAGEAKSGSPTLNFDLTKVRSGRSFDILLMPGPAASSGLVDLTFDAPTEASIATSAVPVGGISSTPDTTVPTDLSSVPASGAEPSAQASASVTQAPGGIPPDVPKSISITDPGLTPAFASANPTASAPIGVIAPSDAATELRSQPLEAATHSRSGDQSEEAALVVFACLGLWIAAIVSRMGKAGPQFTLYRGSPPPPETRGTNDHR